MTSNQFTKRPPNIIQYLERNLQESESDDDCELDDNSESDSGKSELDEEYYRLQPPPIPEDVLIANTVHLDTAYLNSVTLPKQNVPQSVKNDPNRNRKGKSELDEEYYRCQQPPIPEDVLLANTVQLDRAYLDRVTLPKQNVAQPVKNVPNRNRNMDREHINEQYKLLKHLETNNRIGNSSSYTRVELSSNVRPLLPIADAEPINEHYEAWKNREIDRIGNSSSYTRLEMARNGRPPVPVADADLSCCTFLCDGIKSCCVIL